VLAALASQERLVDRVDILLNLWVALTAWAATVLEGVDDSV
jgi:hypothetical protein